MLRLTFCVKLLNEYNNFHLSSFVIIQKLYHLLNVFFHLSLNMFNNFYSILSHKHIHLIFIGIFFFHNKKGVIIYIVKETTTFWLKCIQKEIFLFHQFINFSRLCTSKLHTTYYIHNFD